MVRPFRSGFLRSQVSKAELLAELDSIDRRQRRHAEWAPFELVDPLPPPPAPSRYVWAEDNVHDPSTPYERLVAEYLKQL